ncbi:FAD-dependent oxidoreductase [Dehalococcoidia bacterium]|nr:FAD-dependent oxidoreductase [Dehalococcoidia bacterium]
MDSYDIIIIGAGTAGITAALRAQELGVSVVALERGQELGGGAGIRLSGGAFHLAMGSMDLEPEAMLAHINKVTEGEIDPTLAMMVSTQSKPSIEWLTTQGIPFKPQGGAHGKFTIDPRGPSRPGRKFNPAASPDLAMRNLHFNFIGQGGTIYYGARALSLTLSANGAKWTVEATTTHPESLRIQARSVIIADGGFQANPQLLDRYLGPNASKGSLRALHTASGDGLTMALEHGAYVAGEGRGVYGHVLHRNAASDENFMPYPMFDGLCLIAPVVDENGILLEHSAADGPELTAIMLAAHNPASFWVVLDEPLWIGPAAGGGPYHASVNPDIEQRGGRVERAETLVQLAQQCDMNPKTFSAAIEHHNGTSQTKLTNPPYYCIPLSPGITFTFPGIAINEKTEVRHKSGSIIPGLYAAGCSSGGIHGKAGGGGYMGGLGIALITGKVAAENAVAHAKESVS